MKRTLLFLLMITGLSLAFYSCQKETSYEELDNPGNEAVPGTSTGTSLFVMAGEPDDCVSPLISGAYRAGTALDASNTVEILVNVTTLGTWNITTGLTNGVRFSGSGNFTTTGLQSIVLTGNGIPLQSGIYFYRAGFVGCKFPITFTAGTVTVNCKSCSYVPVCDGSRYTYIDTTASGVNPPLAQNYTYLRDSIIDGKIYQKFAITNSSGDAFFNCTGGVTTSIVLNGNTIGGVTVPRVELIMLKANSPVGTTWQNSIDLGGGISAQYNFSIVAKGISRTVLGTVFPDVIHVHADVNTVVPGVGSTPVATAEYYFARDVGLVENIQFNVTTPPGTMVLHRVLQSYFIP
jgi:hypothetical protein